MANQRSTLPPPAPILAQRDILGESPAWCPEEQALYWIDVRKPALYRLKPDTNTLDFWVMPSIIGSFALRKGGGVLVALADRLAFFDPASRRLETAAPLPAGLRSNDGKCDRAGRFWVGTMRDDEQAPVGTLYRLDADRSLHTMASQMTVPNSLAWSPDNRTLYHADSPRRAIYAYDFDPATGALGARRVFAKTEPPNGFPDGSTVDAEGCLWNAEYAGSRVVRYTPDGRIERTIELPVSQPTSCAFGGGSLDVLYVTTSRQRMSAEQIAREPLAGGLFAFDLGIKGLPEPRFAG